MSTCFGYEDELSTPTEYNRGVPGNHEEQEVLDTCNINDCESREDSFLNTPKSMFSQWDACTVCF